MASYQNPNLTPQAIQNAEHIDPGTTGDNIAAKKVANFDFDGDNWQRSPLPFIDQSADDIVLSNYSGTTPQTIQYKKNGSVVRTLTLTLDGSGNITEVARS